jgi:hypothetical protein
VPKFLAASPLPAITHNSVDGACAGFHDLDMLSDAIWTLHFAYPHTTLHYSGNPLVLHDPDLEPRSQ